MKKLYHVTVEYEVYLMAEDEREAEFVAEDAVRNYEYDLGAESIVACGVVRTPPKEKYYLPSEWRKAQPFNQDEYDERTCEEIVEQEREAARIKALRDAEPCLPGMIDNNLKVAVNPVPELQSDEDKFRG